GLDFQLNKNNPRARAFTLILELFFQSDEKKSMAGGKICFRVELNPKGKQPRQTDGQKRNKKYTDFQKRHNRKKSVNSKNEKNSK
ncbi:hypothetical protein, partial [Alistipes sp.]|uniref:hypothetical protein n=1 Tax=Alistipes sp. TaxID=1872444 RepID=UPI003AB63FDF